MIVTFYSYKGGTGRSLALANVAVLLASQGHRVLAVDFDLEAPGLSRYLQSEADPDILLDREQGLLDLLVAVHRAEPEQTPPDWRDFVTTVRRHSGGELSLMTSGRRDEDYATRVLAFEWDDFFAYHGGGDFIERMRDDWRKEYDFVLVDSRTGITDTGGICTIQLPDVIVAVFTASEQSVGGVLEVLGRAERGRQALAYDRAKLSVVPLPSRFEAQTEYELARRWLDRFVRDFAVYYQSWVPRRVPVRKVLERTALPYVPYFSYGEPLPVMTEGTTAPGSLGYTLGTLARLLAGRLSNAEEIVTGDGGQTTAELSLPTLIAETEAALARMDPELSQQLWHVLCRMVRIDEPEPISDQVALSPGSLDVTLLRDEVERQLAELPVIRVSGGTAVWVDDTVVRIWQALKDRIRQHRDFFAWAQGLRHTMTRPNTVLTGAALVDALAWRRDRWADLIVAEREYVDLSEAEAKKARRSEESRWIWLSVVIGAVGMGSAFLVERFDGPEFAGWVFLATLVVTGLLIVETREHRWVIRESPRDPIRLREQIVKSLLALGYQSVSGNEDLMELRPKSRLRRVRMGTVYLALHRDGDRRYLIVHGLRRLIRSLRHLDDALTV
jgi:cellulose biosynthesis protein BcsQ